MKTKVGVAYIWLLVAIGLIFLASYYAVHKNVGQNFADYEKQELLHKVSKGLVNDTLDVISPVILSYLDPDNLKDARKTIDDVKLKSSSFTKSDLKKYEDALDQFNSETKMQRDKQKLKSSALRFVEACEALSK